MIYLDNAATTKPSRTAIEKASVFNSERFYNPSALYGEGVSNSKEIKQAKEIILSSLGANSKDFDVIFTSCGSESDNMAVFCAKKRGVFVTDKGEHAAIHKCFLELKQRNLQVEFIDLNNDGSVNTEKLYSYLKNNPVDFVSIVHVNNETGAINDINEIAKRVKEINKNTIFHSDGVQAFGKIPFTIDKCVDMYSISAHKVNGLKGVGALIKRKNLVISPLIHGGGQEGGLRSGTENIFGIKVFEYATQEHYKSLSKDYEKIKSFNNYVRENIDKNIFTIISSLDASPYVLSVSAKGLKGEVLMHSLEEFGIIVGNGSACSSKNKFSRVIEACSYKKDVLDGVIRISFSNENTQEEVEFATKKINEVANKLKGIMLWTMQL